VTNPRARERQEPDPPDGKIEMSCSDNAARPKARMSRAFRQAFVRETAS
jgi:hypothetical protein